MLEDLNVRGMLLNSKLSRHISDASWREFRRMLEYKTKWYGSKLVVVARFYPSSKLCSTCSHIVQKLPLTIRQWQCEKCQSMHDRDEKAAKNLLKLYTGSFPGIHACGDTSGGGTGNWSTSHVSLKQEVMSGIFVHKL